MTEGTPVPNPLRFACTEHHVVVEVDPTIRALTCRHVGHVPGGCRVLTRAHLACDDPDAPVGGIGPINASTGKHFCVIVRQDQVTAEEWTRALGGG